MANRPLDLLTSSSDSEGGGEEVGRGEEREKEELISRILELQNTLHDLTQRVNTVKEENGKLKSENEVLNQYVENLMVTSGIFKSADAKPK